MFPDNISQNIDILVVINVWKNNFGFHSNRKTQGQKHRVNNLYFKYQVCQINLKHLNTFLQFRLLFHKLHCRILVKISKKEEHFSFILFHEESESAIRFQKFSFWNFHFSILFAKFNVRESSQKFWKLFFSFYNMIADGLSNAMALYYVF